MRKSFTLLATLFVALSSTTQFMAESPAPMTLIRAGRLLDPRTGSVLSPAAVLIGMTYGYLPLMVLPIYVSLEKLDLRLLEASADLGASPWRSFWQVTLPLSLPGVATGSMLVFILLQAVYLSRHIEDPSTGSGQDGSRRDHP